LVIYLLHEQLIGTKLEFLIDNTYYSWKNKGTFLVIPFSFIGDSVGINKNVKMLSGSYPFLRIRSDIIRKLPVSGNFGLSEPSTVFSVVEKYR